VSEKFREAALQRGFFICAGILSKPNLRCQWGSRNQDEENVQDSGLDMTVDVTVTNELSGF